MSNRMRALVVGALIALALVVLAVILLTDSDDKAKPDEPDTTTTTEATSTTTLPPTTTTTQPSGFATPEDAIRAYIEAQGHEYAGDCASTSLESDVGKWCSGLGSDGGSTRTYYIGPTFSEGAEQLTLTRTSSSAGDRWTVTAHEAIPPIP